MSTNKNEHKQNEHITPQPRQAGDFGDASDCSGMIYGESKEAMNQSQAKLQQAAQAAYAAGTPWATFYREHADAIDQIPPDCREHEVGVLLHLVATGTPSGQVPLCQLDLFNTSEAYH